MLLKPLLIAFRRSASDTFAEDAAGAELDVDLEEEVVVVTRVVVVDLDGRVMLCRVMVCVVALLVFCFITGYCARLFASS
jgi:hypothetical protein